ncbi:MAG: hypothetical protein JMJ93_03995 [Synergistaceae bacterium]|nr:hypothetical protein [Synergistaceae bacterium]
MRRHAEKPQGIGDAAEEDGPIGEELLPVPEDEAEGLVACGDDQIGPALSVTGEKKVDEETLPRERRLPLGVEVIDGEGDLAALTVEGGRESAR